MKSLVADPVTLAYHELRAPLGLVATAARSAAADCEDESLRLRCEMIVRAAERMLRTTHRVLSLAQASQEGDRTSVVIDDVVAIVAEDASAMGWPVRVVEATCGGEVDVSRDLLDALIQSLLSNAYDHACLEEGIRVTTRREGHCAIVEVVNTIGAGRRHHGLGAGTYLAQRLAAQMGGLLDTEVDGDTYRTAFTLPLRDEGE